jgi:MaoC like domain
MKELAFADILIGGTAWMFKTVTEADIVNFAGVTSDFNPVHVDAEYASSSMLGDVKLHRREPTRPGGRHGRRSHQEGRAVGVVTDQGTADPVTCRVGRPR